MDIKNENRRNKLNLTMSIILGIITLIAVVSLSVIAVFVEFESVAVKVVVIVLAVLTGIVGIVATCILDILGGYFTCRACGENFRPSLLGYISGPHSITRRLLRCPKCHKITWCKKHVIIKPETHTDDTPADSTN